MTLSKMTDARVQRELNLTLIQRRQRRLITPEKLNSTNENDTDSASYDITKETNEKSMVEQLLKKRL